LLRSTTISELLKLKPYYKYFEKVEDFNDILLK
jgi:hypothetical protein